MTEKATLELCVLWEGELRAASKLIHKLHDADDQNMPNAEYNKLVMDTLNACMVALWDIGDTPIVLLASEKIRRKRSAPSGGGEPT